jgi:hypothetical protein
MLTSQLAEQQALNGPSLEKACEGYSRDVEIVNPLESEILSVTDFYSGGTSLVRSRLRLRLSVHQHPIERQEASQVIGNELRRSGPHDPDDLALLCVAASRLLRNPNRPA